MAADLVERWFGPAFGLLHPQLQALHRQGGVLRGPCEVRYGTGLAGVAGKMLARRLGIAADASTMTVTIDADATGLLWSRSFNDSHVFASHFEPVGHYPDGYWLERTGPLTLRFGVLLNEGAWHWQQQRLRWLGRTVASKAVVDGAYVFSVAVQLPLLGQVLSYQGTLALQT